MSSRVCKLGETGWLIANQSGTKAGFAIAQINIGPNFYPASSKNIARS